MSSFINLINVTNDSSHPVNILQTQNTGKSVVETLALYYVMESTESIQQDGDFKKLNIAVLWAV